MRVAPESALPVSAVDPGEVDVKAGTVGRLVNPGPTPGRLTTAPGSGVVSGEPTTSPPLLHEKTSRADVTTSADAEGFSLYSQ